MPYRLITVRLVIAGTLASLLFLYKPSTPSKAIQQTFPSRLNMPGQLSAGMGENEEAEEAYNEARALYEFKMLRNPVTGTIPDNIHEIELATASNIPEKAAVLSRSAAYRGMNLNTYQSSGPNNIAGRSRTVEFDRRNTNILISGGTQGGIFRSTDGGANWTFVSPANDIRSVTSVAQDPTQPDTW